MLADWLTNFIKLRILLTFGKTAKVNWKMLMKTSSIIDIINNFLTLHNTD